MKILYDSAQVQKAINKIFGSSHGRRVAITAFVGNNASAYLPNPKGIELVCWPKAGGTNPTAIRDLINREVSVSFANAVHMKVYWTEDKGAVITSANLSTNALGSGKLKEVGILIPSDMVNIDKILITLKAHLASEAEIDDLDKAHKEYMKRNPRFVSVIRKKPTFGKWYLSKSRPKWKLARYYEGVVRLADKSKFVLKSEHGDIKHAQLMSFADNFFEDSDWLLCFNLDTDNPRWAEWVFAHHKIVVPKSDKAYRSSGPYQIIQVYPLNAYKEQAPFNIDQKFRQALKKAVKEFGGVEALDNLTSARPTKKLIDLMYKHYR